MVALMGTRVIRLLYGWCLNSHSACLPGNNRQTKTAARWRRYHRPLSTLTPSATQLRPGKSGTRNQFPSLPLSPQTSYTPSSSPSPGITLYPPPLPVLSCLPFDRLRHPILSFIISFLSSYFFLRLPFYIHTLYSLFPHSFLIPLDKTHQHYLPQTTITATQDQLTHYANKNRQHQQ